MNKPKPLRIPEKHKIPGLYVFCMKCKSMIQNNKCDKTKKSLNTCRFTEKHVFRAITTVPDTNGKKRKSRTFNTRDVVEAIQLKFEFDQELKDNAYQIVTEITELEEESKPSLLIECMASYISYLNNEGLEAHQIKYRSVGHLKDFERQFKNLCLCLKKNKIDYSILEIDQINSKVVGLFHTYLLKDKKYQNKTYNNTIGLFRRFFNWLIKNQDYQIKNPFNDVVRRHTTSNNEIVTQSEFRALLDSVNEENGKITLSTGERKTVYKSWMKDAFILALETGLRREEFMNLKFSDITFDNNGKALYFKIENYKVNRSKKIEEDYAKQYKTIPITIGLRNLLDKIGLKDKINSSEYIVGNEERANRKTLSLIVSKSFTHFWKQTGIKKDVQLKNLRKTYLTSLYAHFGEKATMISDHAGMDVVKKHYLNSEALIEAQSDFQIFGDLTTKKTP